MLGRDAVGDPVPSPLLAWGRRRSSCGHAIAEVRKFACGTAESNRISKDA